MSKIEEKVELLVAPTIKSLGYELYDVIYEKEAQDYYLRIFIDKPEGIDLKDCETVNDAITNMLDEANYIKDQYFLEVSSPGIERVLRKNQHLAQNIGKEIMVKLFKPMTISEESVKQKTKHENTTKELEGTLIEFDENTITIQTQEQTIPIERKNISVMKIKYHWE